MRPLPLLLLICGTLCAGPLTAGRAPDQRAKLVRKHGGSSATEKAVANALAWLARHQSEAGFWDADGFGEAAGQKESDGKGGGWHGEPVPSPFDREVTALAALAFLGAGHRPGDGKYGVQLDAALEWLGAGVGQGTLFAIAYTTQAFAEAWDLTGETRYREAARRGVEVMLGCRHPSAGWRYSPGMAMASGVPTTTAVVVALRTAEECGIEVDDDTYRREVLAWLDKLVDRGSGKIAYHMGAKRLGYTPTTTNAASGLLIRAWLGVPVGDVRNRKGIAVLGKRKPRWSIRFKRMKVNGREREVQIGFLQHYYWWHATEALAKLRPASWSSWNGALKKALLPKQRKSGPWAGSWDPVGTYGKVGGRVFSTALCTLMLESYYRVR